MRHDLNREQYQSVGIDYQDFSRQFVTRLSGALRKESWGRTAIQLAWTAGPVTYLALNGGYYIGFGVPAPPQLFFYFGGYTVIAGLFAVLVRVGYNTVRGHEHERMETALTEVMGDIPALIAAVRNRNLETLVDDDRKFLSAKYLLDNVDSSEQAIHQVTLDLTGDPTLAETMRSIEVFRRAGLFTRVQDLSLAAADDLARVLPMVEQRSVAVAEQFRRRFAGLVPSKRQGRIRTEGFIERVLSAGEHDNYDLMSLSDVEEVLTLAFELLAGRTYTHFSLNYVGKSALRDVDHRFQRARRELREAIHVRNSRLRVLAEFLNESEAIHRIPAAIPVILAVREVYSNVREAADDIYEQMRERGADHGRRFNTEEARLFRAMLHLWESLYRANETVNRCRALLGRVMKEYGRRLSSSRPDNGLRILAPGQRGDGVRLAPREVGLTARKRMLLALRLSEALRDVSIRGRFVHTAVADEQNEAGELTIEGYKHMAVSVAIELDQTIALGNGDVQSAIEVSAAANVGAIETGLSREARIGWGVALVHEVREDTGKAIGRLVSSLAYYHGMQITDEAVTHLVSRYGARESLLRRFEHSREAGLQLPEVLERLDHQFLDVRPLSRSHYALADRMQRRLQEISV